MRLLLLKNNKIKSKCAIMTFKELINYSFKNLIRKQKEAIPS
jgi:hypothetical protein